MLDSRVLNELEDAFEEECFTDRYEIIYNYALPLSGVVTSVIKCKVDDVAGAKAVFTYYAAELRAEGITGIVEIANGLKVELCSDGLTALVYS